MAEETMSAGQSALEEFLDQLIEDEHRKMFEIRLKMYEAIGPVDLRKHNKASFYAALMMIVGVTAAQEDASKRLTEEQFVATCRLGYRACKEFFVRRAVEDVVDQIVEHIDGAPPGVKKH